MAPANAAANPGQALVNDYGQSDAEVAVEIRGAVEGSRYVKAALATYTSAHSTYLYRASQESKARAAYLSAVRSKVRTRIVRTQKAYVAAHALTVKAAAADKAARLALAAVRARITAQVKALHYRPVDGTFTGSLQNYLVPTTPKFSFEPMQVRITVYGGHVSNVEVIKQAAPTSDSAHYNEMSLSTLMIEAMSANDTAKVAYVSGASLSSEAFEQSLTAALIAAGFKV
jgi:uncharacterized protein with FMN-binding domain